MVHRRKRPIKYIPRSSLAHHSANVSPSVPAQPTIIIKRYVSCETQTDPLPHSRRNQFAIQELESVNRITNLPIVETGISYAENVYNKIKKSNNLLNWTLEQAENSVHTVFDAATPAIILLKGPISAVDKLVCKSLDVVEHTVPQINLPPQMIYWNTKQYVADVGTKIARPVLKRTDSMKQIGNAVLSSKYTAYAADKVDGALDVVEKYVDKYLPADDEKNASYDEVDAPVDGPAGKAVHAVKHAKGFSRKLKRRLTQRTIAEVKALKHQSAEAVNVLIYVAELVATDPIMAFQKGKELWGSLSKDEPENQTRPENLEQLIVLLTRESARRMVHMVNFSYSMLSTIPKTVSHSLSIVMSSVLHLTDSMVKTYGMENVQNKVVKVLKIQGRQLAIVLKEANQRVNNYLDHVAENLDTKEQPKTVLSVPKIKVQPLKASKHSNSVPKVNGVENSNNL